MKLYKETAGANTGNFFGFESDGSQDYLITPTMVIVSPEEMNPLARRKETIWEIIKAERIRRDDGGFLINCAGAMGKWFHTDQRSLSTYKDFKEALELGLIPPQGIAWKTMDGTWVMMTADLYTYLTPIRLAHRLASFPVAEAHKAAMLLVPDPENYDYSSGWPAIYEG